MKDFILKWAIQWVSGILIDLDACVKFIGMMVEVVF